MNIAEQMENTIETMSSLDYSFFIPGIVILLMVIFIPFLYCLSQGNLHKGVVLFGRALLGLLAFVGIIFAPLGISLIFSAYEDAFDLNNA